MSALFTKLLSSLPLSDRLRLISFHRHLAHPPFRLSGECHADVTVPCCTGTGREDTHMHLGVRNTTYGAQTACYGISQRAGVVSEGFTEEAGLEPSMSIHDSSCAEFPSNGVAQDSLSCDHYVEAKMWRLVSGMGQLECRGKQRLVANEFDCLGLQMTENQAQSGLNLRKLY